MEAVGYVRRSTDKQELSLDAQRDAIQAWCKAKGLTLAAIHEEAALSGSLGVKDRPALAAALADVEEREAGALVVAKRDRLARRLAVTVEVTERLAALGAELVAADGVGNGKRPEDEFVATIFDGYGVMERKRTAQRTSAAMQAWGRRDGYVGGRPRYGYAAGPARPERQAKESAARKLVPVPDEQATVARARELAGPRVSLRKVAALLEAEGRVSRTGRPFAAQQVKRMLGK